MKDSVIFIDEFQLLPIDMRRDVVDYLYRVADKLNATIIFSSATNTPWQKKYTDARIQRLIPYRSMPKVFRRVKAHYDKQITSLNDLARAVEKHKQVVCVTNVRRAAQDLADLLPMSYVLTTLQNTRHRIAVLQTCRELLAQKRPRLAPVTLVSTQAIESGVDIDFPWGFRQMGPFESIIQVGGRVNRHGRRRWGHLIVFDLPDAQYQLPSPYYQAGIAVVRGLIGKRGKINIYNLNDLKRYFNTLANETPGSREVTVDGVKVTIETARKKLYFESVAKEMNIIGDRSEQVLAPANEVELEEMLAAIAILKTEKANFNKKHNAMMILQDFMVSLYSEQVENLRAQGLIEDTVEGLDLCRYTGEYNPRYGIPIRLMGKGNFD